SSPSVRGAVTFQRLIGRTLGLENENSTSACWNRLIEFQKAASENSRHLLEKRPPSRSRIAVQSNARWPKALAIRKRLKRPSFSDQINTTRRGGSDETQSIVHRRPGVDALRQLARIRLRLRAYGPELSGILESHRRVQWDGH